MKKKYFIDYISPIIIFFSFIHFFGCQSYNLIREAKVVSEFTRGMNDTTFMKIHLKNGDVYLLKNWEIDPEKKEIKGRGELYDFNRDLKTISDFNIAYDKIALIETNVLEESMISTWFTVLTVVHGAITVFCLTNPKMCFGSCPTFYAWDGDQMTLQAEGFSSSIARSLEAKDIDHLYSTKPTGRDFELKVTNEAMETHVIRYINLLAGKHNEGNRVHLTRQNEFYETSGSIPPSVVMSENGDVTVKFRYLNDEEYYSTADSNDLVKKEIIEIMFGQKPEGSSGLLLGFRQSLLTTYLFYQMIAYMGNSYGYFLSKIETGNDRIKELAETTFTVLGGIEVYILDKSNEWIKVEVLNETGPIARNLQLIKLPENVNNPIKIKLIMTKGMWRLDHCSLTSIIKEVEPIRLMPTLVSKNEICDDNVRELLLDSSKTFTTLPGDSYSIFFTIPEDYSNYDYFVETQGYYYEWMRDAWLKEENLDKVTLLFTNPKKFLKEVAVEFKKIEYTMDKTFWRSKYENK